MRTMPSDTEVTVPSLRASADSLTFSMRALISSLISDGLSVEVAILVSCRAGLDPPRAVLRFRSAGRNPPCEFKSMGQRGLQALQLAAHGTVDDDVAGIDHRAADQAGVDRGLDLDLAAEALAQRGLDRLQFGGLQRGGGGDLRLHHALGLEPQLVVQAGDLRQQREAAVVEQ